MTTERLAFLCGLFYWIAVGQVVGLVAGIVGRAGDIRIAFTVQLGLCWIAYEVWEFEVKPFLRETIE